MQFRSFYPKAFLSVGLLIVLTGCGPSKVEQCNSLSKTFEKGTVLGNKFQQAGQTFQTRMQKLDRRQGLQGFKSGVRDASKEFRSLIGEWDQLTKEVGAVPLKDEKLVSLQRQYVTGLSQYSSGFKTMVGSLEKMGSFDGTPAGAQKVQGNLQEMQTAYNGLTKLGVDLQRLDGEFKSYCTGK
jgi:hypothetical protein